MSSAEKVFYALGSTTRRKILAYLSETSLTSGEIAERFDMSQPAVSKHLSVLEGAGLVWRKREGQFVRYGMEQENLAGTLAAEGGDREPSGDSDGRRWPGPLTQLHVSGYRARSAPTLSSNSPPPPPPPTRRRLGMH